MGAYENPRLINAPDFATGFENFDKKFQAGLKEGFAEGQRKIEEDKNYVSSVEERADAMRKKGEAAIANSQKTREQLEGELDKFYKKALEIEPGGKGIGGLFTGGRKMLGDMDLKRLENDFSDKMAPINAMYNKIYDPEWDFGKDVDKNSDHYDDLKIIKNAVEAGRIDTGIKFIEGDKDKNIPMGWDSGLKVFDDKGNVVKEYSAADLSRIMGTNTKQMRESIDARDEEIGTNAVNKVTSAIANKGSDLQVEESLKPGSTKAQVLRPEDHLHGSIAEQIRTDSFYIKNDQTGVYETIQPNADGTYAAVVDEESELAGLFANHGIKYLKTNAQDAINMLKRTVPSLENIDDSKLKLILNSNMNMGTEKIKSILGDDFNKVFKNFQANKTLLKNAGVSEGYEESVLELEGKTPAEVIKSIHDGQAITKAAIYHESVKKDVMDGGLLNKAYVPPAKASGGGSPSAALVKYLDEKNEAQTWAAQRTQATLDLVPMVNTISTNAANRDPLSTTPPNMDISVADLGFSEISFSDGGKSQVKQVQGAYVDNSGDLIVNFIQSQQALEGEDENNPGVLQRKVVKDPSNKKYKVNTIKGLEELYHDIEGEDSVKGYKTYFQEKVRKGIELNFEANPAYLAHERTQELRDGLIGYYGGIDNIKKGGAAAYPELYAQKWFQDKLTNGLPITK